jgi:hypothetical protein
MKRSAVAIVVGVLVLGVVATALWLWPYSVREFRGDGQITDTGFWSYPRYQVRFPPVELSQAGQHTFTCRGLPPAPLTLLLATAGKDEAAYDSLSRIGTVVTVRIDDDTGQTVYSASGPLKAWVLMWGYPGNAGGYWHENCRDMRLRRGRTYQLGVGVTAVDPAAPAVVVQPTLEGGGNELP